MRRGYLALGRGGGGVVGVGFRVEGFQVWFWVLVQAHGMAMVRITASLDVQESSATIQHSYLKVWPLNHWAHCFGRFTLVTSPTDLFDTWYFAQIEPPPKRQQQILSLLSS